MNKNLFFIILICLIGLYLRLYQVNFQDYWLDEQASFYVADPSLLFKETVERSYNLDYGTHILFNLILKFFFDIFYYNSEIGRIVPLIFGFLSIPVISYLTYYITKNKSYIFVTFLASINFYLISYSQELREYSLVFLLSSLSILFFYRLIDSLNYSKNNFFNNVFYTLFTLIGICTHIFFFIIIFSQITYLFLIYYIDRKKIFLILINIVLIFTIYLLLMYDILLLQMSINDFWIKNVELDFLIDLYFPRFFGSHIMGAIYLLTLLYLLILSRKKLFQAGNKNLLLVVLLFFSYLIPIVYGIIAMPVLTDRYIIYALIPILVLISNLTFNLKDKKIKISIIFIIITSSLTNNYSEIFKRKISKPEFNLALESIFKSDIKNIFIKAQRPLDKKIVNNYLQSININKKYNIVFYDKINNLNENSKFWLLCYEPINSFNCNLDDNENNLWKYSTKYKFHLLKATLYKK
jgi:hypothetical protein